MLIELGNHCALHNAIDDRPKVTTIHIPEADETGLGGYTHKPGGIDTDEFKLHLADSLLNGGITHLPDHELLQATVAAWSAESKGSGRPAWVHVTDHALTPDGHGADVEQFLSKFYDCPTGNEFFNTTDVEELTVKKELTHWTKTAPGLLGSGLSLPNATALYTNAGRVINNINDGGGQVGITGTATATSATSLTSGSVTSLTANQYAGYRLYAPTAWANILSHTSGTTPVFTIDRWYSYATPGGSAASTPSGTTTYVIADGGAASSWFVGMTTTNISPSASDTALSGEYTTAGGGCIRKIAPYAQTSGVASRSYTLTPVYTANGSDTFPSTFYAIGVFVSMVVASTPLCMKFETSLNASATINLSGDQVTVTETVTGS